MNELDFAVIVGVNDYPDFSPLYGPVDDAKRFYGWLTKETGGAVPVANCANVYSSTNPPVPLQYQIDQKFKEIWDELKRKRKETGAIQARRLYFYFSGHGIGVKLDNTALLLANFSEDFYRDSALSSKGYLDKIVSSGRFKEVVFFFDCCRTQLAGVTGMPPSFSWPRDSDLTGKTSIFIASATEYKDEAYEAEVQTIPGEIKTEFRSLFTEALLKGLEGEAADPTIGKVTPESLKKYLEIETPIIALAKGHSQKARVENGFTSDSDAFFGGDALTQRTYRIKFRADRSGTVLLLNGNADTIKEGEVNGEPWEIELLAGKYILMHLPTREKLPILVRPQLESSKGKVEIEF